ncbi:type II toxin-antitoxin system PemK/MazF family toxin [Georgenia ruanii]|uniref:Type II toxin-antitoxin system PemK/MazF family toxin n=1 Tax=Georgenia ruanii TaxID=348442 RepID=A0A7J9UV88_9MICO|nr:type II toxin-antitoxin system PemK/MazF family toxin [Georgenia ruanii]MPV88273.1 type II toxin-antitoxin system PemK/MazF family toxin [Georgenia ruanii]
MSSSIWRRALGAAGAAAASAVTARLRGNRSATPPSPRRQRSGTARRGAASPAASPGERQVQAASRETVEYDVARLGLPALAYAARHDDQPDPGEVVWTWVPYDDDPDQGKDRPVLVLAREGAGLVVAQMTSQDHDKDAADEARWGRRWIDVGSGAWDARGRPSEVRLDRLLWVDPEAVRRQGAALAPARFAEVTRALRELHG